LFYRYGSTVDQIAGKPEMIDIFAAVKGRTHRKRLITAPVNPEDTP